MRSGATTLQQTLTPEAASILKHSLGLARRRGHAQVTPLHVAATLLSLRSSLLRRACLKSQQQQLQSQQPQPQQCRALELCFNVALNRLPANMPAPSLLHSQSPSLSNALIAALKRAQAHQRRGCIEQQQQQPLLTIKVELEQLIVSILDDPSVSRVMREAGFSSTAVKNNIEDLSSSSSSPRLITPSSVFYNSSGGVFSSPCSPSYYSCSSDYAPAILFASPQKKPPPPVTATSSREDIKAVMDVLLSNKRKNVVIVGDSASLTEGLVTELAGKMERGDVPEELKSVRFVRFQLAPSPVSLRFMKREEVEMNLSALKRKVEVAASGGGAIFCVGDLKWTVEEGGGGGVEHLVGEIGKLFNGEGKWKNKVWVMGTASYQTYMRCQMKGLDNHWCLHPLPLPSSAGLALTLHASSVYDSKMSMMETKLFNKEEEHDMVNCCEECVSNYEKEAQLFKPGQNKLLPSWLQSHSTTESGGHQKDELAQLKRKWNRLCHCLHQTKQPQSHWNNNNTSLYGNNNNHQTSNYAKIYPYNSSYPWWPQNQLATPFTDSSSISFAAAAKPARFRRQQSCTTIEFNFNDVTQNKKEEPTTLEDSVKGINGEGNKEVKITLALGNSEFGGSSGKTTVVGRAHICKLLQENVPWQSETVPSIAEALAAKQCSASTTWLFLQGNDSVGKTRLARAVAESVFGSADSLLRLDMKKSENHNNSANHFSEILAGTLDTNEKTVVLIESVDFADAKFKKFLAEKFEASKFANFNGKGAIFILTSGGGGNRSNIEEHNHKDSVMRLVLKINETRRPSDDSPTSPCLGHKKRMAELDLFGNNNKKRVTEEKEEKKVFSRQSSFTTLDLNMKADEEEDDEDEEEEEEEYDDHESSPISSDLTREMGFASDNGFLGSIENRFNFNRSDNWGIVMEEMFVSKIKGSFEEVCGGRSVKFSVEGKVIEEIGVGCGSFTNNMFEKWLKDIFQRIILQQEKVVNFGEGREGGIVFTLCWGGKGDTRKMDSGGGFMGSCLPKNIQVCNYFN